MELLSPAGNIEKLKYAYLFGADAAYIGIKDFSLRGKADNLRSDNRGSGLKDKLVKIKGEKKLYGALNIYFHDDDLRRLERELDFISGYPFDAFIVSDIGVVPILKKHFPDIPLHLSTQANCINSEAVRIYRDMGFTRIVPGRELNLSELARIKDETDVELEVFVHGAMCLAYSGRCFLSSYMAERSANRGHCAHSCRWNYRVLEEEERQGEYFPVIEGENFTTILSSKDLCMIDHLEKLRSAGVDSIKIEGRMKSIYYTAIITRAYRKALDRLNGSDVPDFPDYREEIFKVSHREFSTGFYFGREEIEAPTQKSYVREYDFLGIIGEQVSEHVFKLEVKNQIRQGETLDVGYDILYIRDAGFDLLDETGNPVPKIDHGKTCFLRTEKSVKEGYLLRKKSL